jgi:hypothetical protein
VGLVRLIDFAKTRHHPRPEVGPIAVEGIETTGGPPVAEVDRFLQQVERNLTALTHAVHMAEIKDLPSDIKPHVLGVLILW